MLMLRLLWMGMVLLGPEMQLGTGQPSQPTRMYRGLVVDSSHRPLVGASIMAKGTRLAASTNSEGRFELLLPAGTFELLIDYPSYLAPRTLAGPPDSALTVVLFSSWPRAARR